MARIDDVEACCRSEFEAIGIEIGDPAQFIDFGALDDGVCADVATAIELCVHARGYFIPALGGTFSILRKQAVTIAFSDLAADIANLIQPKSIEPDLRTCPVGPHAVSGNPCPTHHVPTDPY